MAVPVTSPRAAADATPPGAPDAATLREDVQGLRVVAVLLVVLFHLWPDAVTGGFVGVDVFFVISGYLITAHLLRHPPATGRDLATFWARRIRRLLPASLLVLALTLVAARLVAPPLTWAATAREAVAAALYVENWSLASSAVDYLAADAAPTPVQHFWSLSVEEQFYLVWPVLVLAAFAAARLRAVRPSGRAVATGAMAAVALGSLAWSVHLTDVDPARAYFVTPVRAWEFAAGGLVAVAAVRPGPRARAVLAWGGLAAVLVAGLAYTGATPFPGSAALLPVLGTAAVIVAGAGTGAGAGADGAVPLRRLWRLPGVQWLGGASYSVYLWHWPLVVLAPYVAGGPLGDGAKVAVLALTLALSALSKPFVEDRFRRPRPGSGLTRVYLSAAAGMALVVALAGLLGAQAAEQDRAAAAQLQERLVGGDACFGAAAVALGPQRCPVDPDVEPVPALSLAADDRSSAYADGCFTGAPYDGRRRCTYGTGPTKVALVGNSHAGQWLPALQEIAAERGWTVTTYLVSLCSVTTARPALDDPAQARNCQAYGRWARDAVARGGYDLVITSSRQSLFVEGEENWPATDRAAREAYRGMLTAWSRAGTQVVVVKDPVVPGDDVGRVPECLAETDGDQERCSWPLAVPVPADPQAYRWLDPLWSAARSLDDPRVRVVEMDDLLCPGGTCRPVLGGVVTYFDASHLTATYARTLAPYLAQRIDGVVPPSVTAGAD